MPKIRDVLNQTHLSNEISNVVKVRWLGELDKKRYTYSEDMDTELKMKNIEVYTTYLKAMEAFFTGDMDDYHACALLFRLAYEEEMLK